MCIIGQHTLVQLIGCARNILAYTAILCRLILVVVTGCVIALHKHTLRIEELHRAAFLLVEQTRAIAHKLVGHIDVVQTGDRNLVVAHGVNLACHTAQHLGLHHRFDVEEETHTVTLSVCIAPVFHVEIRAAHVALYQFRHERHLPLQSGERQHNQFALELLRGFHRVVRGGGGHCFLVALGRVVVTGAIQEVLEIDQIHVDVNLPGSLTQRVRTDNVVHDGAHMVASQHDLTHRVMSLRTQRGQMRHHQFIHVVQSGVQQFQHEWIVDEA